MGKGTHSQKETETMIEVTADEWAEHLAKEKCYHREAGPLVSSDHSRMQTVAIAGYDLKQNIISGPVLGEVRYHDNIHKTYWLGLPLIRQRQANLKA